MITRTLRCGGLLAGACGGMILSLSACTIAGVSPDGTFQTAGLLVESIPESDTSAGIMKISDPESDLNVLVAGVRDENGVATVTTLSGKTAEAVSFSAFVQDGTVTRASVAGHDLLVEPVEEGVVTLSLELAEPAARTLGYLDVTFDKRLEANWSTLRKEIDLCNSCPSDVRSNLNTIMALTDLQLVVNNTFNRGCIESDAVSGQQCFDLLAIVDSLGSVLNAVVQSSADLPFIVTILCFDLAGECSSNPSGTGDDNSTPNDGDQNDSTNGNDNQAQDDLSAVSLNGCWSIVLPANESTLNLERNEIWEFSNEQLIRTWKPQTTGTLEVARFDEANAAGSVSNTRQSTTIAADERRWTLTFAYTIGQIDRRLVIDDGTFTNGDALDGTYQEHTEFITLEGSGGSVEVNPSGSFAGAKIDCPNPDAENVLTQEEFIEKASQNGP